MFEPKAPLSALIAAAFGLDILWPLFVLTGIEFVSVAPGNTAFTPLAFDSYPWSHSLALAIVWGGAGTGLTYGLMRNRRISLLAGAVVISHWFLDFVTHRPDLPLWPGGPKLGLGLWNSIPGTLVVEGGLFVAAIVMFVRASTARDSSGTWSLWTMVGLSSLIWATQPWSPPPPTPNAVAGVALTLVLLPVWGHWIDRHRRTLSIHTRP